MSLITRVIQNVVNSNVKPIKKASSLLKITTAELSTGLSENPVSFLTVPKKTWVENLIQNIRKRNPIKSVKQLNLNALGELQLSKVENEVVIQSISKYKGNLQKFIIPGVKALKRMDLPEDRFVYLFKKLMKNETDLSYEEYKNFLNILETVHKIEPQILLEDNSLILEYLCAYKKDFSSIVKNNELFSSVQNELKEKCDLDVKSAMFSAMKYIGRMGKNTQYIGDNPILSFAKTNEQRTAIEDAFCEISSIVQETCTRESQEKITQYLAEILEKTLKEQGLIPINSKISFQKLNKYYQNLAGLCYKISGQDASGEHLFEELALKVFKRKDIGHSQIRGGVFNEIKTAKYIQDNAGIDIKSSDTNMVYGADLFNGYMLSRFVSEKLEPIISKVDFAKLGLEYTDEKSANRLFGRLVDFGAFIIDEDNKIWKTWSPSFDKQCFKH